MTFIVKPFDTYQIKYLSFTDNSGNSRVYAAISCYNGSQYVGVLWFLDTYPIADQNIVGKDGLKIIYHTRHFNDIVGILRYEKPLRLEFDTDKKEGSLLTATWEPAGEQEGV
jgi:hypothetical protein